jgi:hypothetical protein
MMRGQQDQAADQESSGSALPAPCLSRIRFMVEFLPEFSGWIVRRQLLSGQRERNLAYHPRARHVRQETRPGRGRARPCASILRPHLPGRVVYHRFRWSGWPSHLARDHAACRLRARLLKCVQNNATAHHCVIAHSHGGNIVCYALRDAAELVEQLDCIITLSTPFLSVRERNLSLFGALSALGSLYLAIFGVFLLGISWALGPSTADEFVDLLRHVGVNGWWSYKSWIAWLIGIVVGRAGLGSGEGPCALESLARHDARDARTSSASGCLSYAASPTRQPRCWSPPSSSRSW